MSDKMVDVYHDGVIRETDYAWLLDLGQGEEVWFPKSQCELEEDLIKVPEWLALEKGQI